MSRPVFTDQVAAQLQVSRWTVGNFIRSHQLDSFTIGCCRRVSASPQERVRRARTEGEPW